MTFGLDLSPLRSSRDFRLLWGSGVITILGTTLTVVALPLQIKALTGSSVAVGAVGAVELVPMVVCGLWGGALADALDRRRLLLWTELAQGGSALVLVVDSLLPHPAVWPLYCAAAFTTAGAALQRPSLDALAPQLVRHDQLASAASLLSLRWNIGAILGPVLAGLIATTAGVAVAFQLDLLSFLASALLLFRLRPVPTAPSAERASLGSITEGLRYARQRRDLLASYAVDFVAMLLAMPTAILPFLADRLHATWALGLMYSSFAIGSLLVGLTSSWARRVHRHGRMIALAAAGWGAAMAGAGLVPNVWVVLFCLVAAGAADMVSGLFRSTLWNGTIPDELRGRLAGIEVLSYSTGPQLASVRSGWTAAALGVRTSVWAGGLACVLAVGAIACALPALWRFDARTDPNARAVRLRRETAPQPAAL
ncbi:MFS transporter [Kitasatospora viridis]|uniref:Putative MFS family arabinose efflux permease n=1 Tax=Kitasatospora viridis TaxID=281105 RepID=A0A561UN41_9ACTN|nr:MFS transporter [Kitasatospora viridis]TWG00786.1 putative MFS family arabinose efflux permease [Kitasatospora viridis]